MKDISYYLRLPYVIILKKNEDNFYESRIAELDGCMSHGKTVQEAIKMIEDAKRCWIEIAIEDGNIIPEPEEDYFSQVIRLYDFHLESKVYPKIEMAVA